MNFELSKQDIDDILVAFHYAEDDLTEFNKSEEDEETVQNREERMARWDQLAERLTRKGVA